MSAKRLDATVWRTLETPHGKASWAVIGGVLHVRSALGEKTTQVGNVPPEILVRLLMSELAQGN
jgi:hypothetical protein